MSARKSLGQNFLLDETISRWIAAASRAETTPSLELEVVDASVEVVDADRDDAWRISTWALAVPADKAGPDLFRPTADALRVVRSGLADWSRLKVAAAA